MKIQLSDLHLREIWGRTRRGVLYALVLLAFLLLQNVVFSHITIFGVHSMFLPALVIAAALYLLYLLIFVVLPMVPTFLEALLKSL